MRRPISSARTDRVAAPRAQTGLVLVVLMIALVFVALSALAARLQSAAQVTTQAARAAATQASIEQAKQALIARAALDISRPGSLPCPSQNEGTGASSGICPGANQRVGRLPWKQLGLPVPYAGNAEPLWYALADAYLDADSSEINSDTGDVGNAARAGMIEIVGDAAQQGVVAVLIDPGPALAGQNRQGANRVNVAHYLEAENNYQLDPGGRNNRRFASAARSDTFNDVVAAITREELFAVVDNAVAMRIDRVIRPALEAYLDAWQALPFSSDRFDPAADLPEATVGRYEGHLPVTLPAGRRLAWQSVKAPVQAGGDAAGFLDETASFCALDATRSDELVCTLVYQGEPEVRIDGRIGNLALVLAGPVRLLSSIPSWPATRPFPSATGRLDSAGSAEFAIAMKLPAPPGSGRYVGELRFGLPSNLLDPATATDDYAWFAKNGWNRLVYYRVADGARESASSHCARGSTGSCLDLHRADGTAAHAAGVLILSGMRLAGRARPSSSRADYLEGANALGGTTFEQRPQSPVFNDRVIGIRRLN